LHEKTVCHRDLKPNNILVATLPVLGRTTGRFKITDFGLATVVGNMKTVCGTPGSPRVLHAAARVLHHLR
jgi:serine/threonine protein kinase